MECNTVTPKNVENKKLRLVLISLLVCTVLTVSYLSFDGWFGKPKALSDTNYIGLLELGLAPNTNSRIPTARDIDTGVRITIESTGDVVALYESRGIEDFGKTFIYYAN